MSEPLGLAKHDCEVHRTHRPSIDRVGRYTVERHHIEPREFGGSDDDDNLVWVCPTGHTAIHELLRLYVRLDGTVPWNYRRLYSRGERELAHEGYKRIVRYGHLPRALAALSG